LGILAGLLGPSRRPDIGIVLWSLSVSAATANHDKLTRLHHPGASYLTGIRTGRLLWSENPQAMGLTVEALAKGSRRHPVRDAVIIETAGFERLLKLAMSSGVFQGFATEADHYFCCGGGNRTPPADCAQASRRWFDLGDREICSGGVFLHDLLVITTPRRPETRQLNSGVPRMSS
jgi:hypothetical protein